MDQNASTFLIVKFYLHKRIIQTFVYHYEHYKLQAELLMRKMMCCLGIAWCNSDHTNDDTQSALTDDYESTKLLLVSLFLIKVL